MLLTGGVAACPAPADPDGGRRVRPLERPRPDRRRAVAPGALLPAIALSRGAASYWAPGGEGGVPAVLRPLFARVRQALKVQGLTLRTDVRLSAAAVTLVGVRPLSRVGSAGLRFALLGHGVVEPHGRLLADEVAGAGGLHRALFARVVAAASAGQLNRIGGAVAVLPGRKLRVVVLLLRTHLRLEPVVRRAVSGATVLLRGGLAPGFAAPRGVVTVPGGRTRRARLTAAMDGSFHALVPLTEGRGVYQLELLGTGPRGPEVLANFPLYVGVPPPTRYVLRPPARPSRRVALDTSGVEKALARQVNQARRVAGQGALKVTGALARVARAHADEMCRRGEVRHYSPTTGTAVDRVRKARIRASWVGENVGRAATWAELHREFLQSPAHRAALLRKGLTHMGVGVCINQSTAGGQTIYVTELFIRAAPAARPSGGR